MSNGLMEFTGKSGTAWRQPLTAMFGHGHMEIPNVGMGLIIGASFVPVDPVILDDIAESHHGPVRVWLWGDARFPGEIIAANDVDPEYGGTACAFVHVKAMDLGPFPSPQRALQKDLRDDPSTPTSPST